MNRVGLELLKQSESKKENFLTQEELILLPEKFKFFLDLYAVGPSAIQTETVVLDDGVEDQYKLTAVDQYDHVLMEGEEYYNTLGGFFDIGRLKDEISNYSKQSENWNKLGFVQIGLMAFADVLLIGVEDSNYDQIWRYGTGLVTNTCSKLENNIFEFVCRAREVLLTEDLDDWGITESQLYKNINERFWRVGA